MPDDLKAKLNAKADVERTARADAEEFARLYREIILREYPRLVRELNERVRNARGGIQGAFFSN